VRLTERERNALRSVVKKLKGTRQKVLRDQLFLKADTAGPNWVVELNIVESMSHETVRHTLKKIEMTNRNPSFTFSKLCRQRRHLTGFSLSRHSIENCRVRIVTALLERPKHTHQYCVCRCPALAAVRIAVFLHGHRWSTLAFLVIVVGRHIDIIREREQL
jgi:hypothetical protein